VVESGGSSSSRREVCKYGKDCYDKNPKHLEDFSHPWLDGETEDQEKDRLEIQEVHDLLSLAKGTKWAEVDRVLKRNPKLVDMRPEGRKYALIHFAAHQLHEKALEIVLKAGADIKAKSQDGYTARQILQANVQALDKVKLGETTEERLRRYDEKRMAQHCLALLDRHERGAGGSGLGVGGVGGVGHGVGHGAGAGGVGGGVGGVGHGVGRGDRPRM